MRSLLSFGIGIFIGAICAAMTLAILFNYSHAAALTFIALPIVLGILSSYFLARNAPEKWLVSATSVATPTLILSIAMTLLLWGESRPSGDWAVVALVAIAVCGLSAWIGQRSN